MSISKIGFERPGENIFGWEWVYFISNCYEMDFESFLKIPDEILEPSIFLLDFILLLSYKFIRGNSFSKIQPVFSLTLERWPAMDIDTKIDDLIEAGWYVLDSEFDDRALAHWKKTASEFLISFLGPRHIVTQNFVYSWESRFDLDIFPDKKGSDTVQ